MPRVLVISAAYPPLVAGESMFTLMLARRFSQVGLDTHVLTSARSGGYVSETFHLWPHMTGWGWSNMPQLASCLRLLQPDVILLNYTGWLYHYHPMITHLPLITQRVAPRSRLVTMITHPAGSIASKCSLPTRLLHRLLRRYSGPACDYSFGSLLSASPAVITLADHFTPILAKIQPDLADRLTVIPPPPLLPLHQDAPALARAEGRRLLRLQESHTLLAYTGLLAPGKGLETLLDAFAHLLPKHPQLRLVLLGGVVNENLSHHPAYARDLMNRIHASFPPQSVIHVGPFDAADLSPSKILAAADLAVLPWDAGIHMNNSTVATVAAHGLPLVSTQPAQLEPIFQDGRNVLLCPPQDGAALAAAIQQLLGDAPLRQRLIQGIGRLHQQHLSWEVHLSQLLQTFFPAAQADTPEQRIAA